jgi:hypothetical protein
VFPNLQVEVILQCEILRSDLNWDEGCDTLQSGRIAAICTASRHKTQHSLSVAKVSDPTGFKVVWIMRQNLKPSRATKLSRRWVRLVSLMNEAKLLQEGRAGTCCYQELKVEIRLRLCSCCNLFQLVYHFMSEVSASLSIYHIRLHATWLLWLITWRYLIST